MYKTERLLPLLRKVEVAVKRIIDKSAEIDSIDYYLTSSAGMERLESTCMLLIAIGESVKGIDKITNKQLLTLYPQIDWRGVMGMRDIIAHHYFDIDAEVVLDVVRNELPLLQAVIARMSQELSLSIK